MLIVHIHRCLIILDYNGERGRQQAESGNYTKKKLYMGEIKLI